MKRAWSNRRVRVVTVSAMVLAASAIIPATGAHAGRCPGASAHGEVAAPAGGREEPAGQGAAPRPRSASLPGGDGIVLKVTFYRGIGGGVTSSYSRDGVGLTFETGVGVGGSFSAGTAASRPDAGMSVEGRASMNSRIGYVKLPDFGVNLAQDGRLQAYMDAKAGNYRTRFRTKPIHLRGGSGESRAEPPETRRSWSLGTEFKLAAADTLWFSWGGILNTWKDVRDVLRGGRGLQAPPIGPVGGPAYAVAAAGPVTMNRPFALRSPGTEWRSATADRLPEPRAFRDLPAIRKVMVSRFNRSRGTPGSSSSRARQRSSRARSGEEKEFPVARL